MAEQLKPEILRLLYRYLWCIMVIQFDVDVGPDLKLMRPSILPNDIKFTEDDFRTICFSALPERTLQSSGSQFYMMSFKPRNAPGSVLHAFILFNQRQDITKARLYTQESLVVISQYRYPEFFRHCLNIIAGCNDFVLLDIDHKIPILDSTINIMSNWPDPKPGPIELGLLGEILNYNIPVNATTPLVDSYYVTCPVERWDEVVSWSKIDREKRYFSGFLDQLYMMYEYLILEWPLTCVVVYSGLPHVVSLFIDLAIDVMKPLSISENRIFEYITIHSDVHSLVTGTSAGIYGVTNPLLLNNLVNNSSGIRPLIINLDNETHEVGARLQSQIKAMNRSIKKNRLLLPNSKFISEISQANDDIHSRIRLHFATLSNRLLAPISGYLKPENSFESPVEFDVEKFEIDVINSAKGLKTDISFDKDLFTSSFLLNNFWKFTTSKQDILNDLSMVKFYCQFVKSDSFKRWTERTGDRHDEVRGEIDTKLTAEEDI